MITLNELKQKIYYNPDDGSFTRILKDGSTGRTNKKKNYAGIRISGKSYPAHRLAWLYMTGEWPSKFIDHINRDPSDNRWCNLREASYAENNRNKSIGTDNTSGYKGVNWHKHKNKWRSEIKVNKKVIHLGYYDNKEEAAEAYIQAAKKYHGEFASF